MNRNLKLSTLAVLLGLTAFACTNAPAKKLAKSLSSTGISSILDSFTIARIDVQASTDTTVTTLPVTVYMDATKTTGVLTNDCNTASTFTSASMPCICQFTWTEVNTTGTTNTSIPRVVQTPVTSVQAAALVCNTPDGYMSEIPSDTSIRLTILPTGVNTKLFSMSSYLYTKDSGTQTGNFKDDQGRSFANILRYSCYSQRQRGMVIQNKMGTVSDPGGLGGGTRTYPIANKFCLRKANGNVAGDATGCTNIDPVDYTAQSYYFNLFIRENESGDINPGNGKFVCPTVKEALSSTGTIGSDGKYWPLDSTFALSLGQTTDFAIGVQANTKTSNPSDPVSSSTDCAGNTTTTTASADSLVSSCMGFAAKPNTDGSCPVLTDSTGAAMRTYRLRRYIALYPPIFDTNGQAIAEPQAVDTVYVLDRPVNTGTATDNYTMLGAKPCPFSYFDNRKVTATNRTYRATNNTLSTGKNVDGIKFPDRDCFVQANGECAQTTTPSCAATLPLVDPTQTFITATSVHSSNPVGAGLFSGDPTRSLKYVHVRPVSAWSAHYEEDVGFQACAPLAKPLRDPPLHLAKLSTDNTKVTWCAEAYPTQNDNVGTLDERTTPNDLSTPFSGNVAPFTSHVPKNATSGCFNNAPNSTNTFTRPTIPANYPAAGLANHTATGWDAGRNATDTCDRTVVNPVNGITWPRFPLLAPPADVEAALQSDDSYACTMTADNGTRTGISSPTQGCCGLATTVVSGAGGATTAHLEPPLAPASTACQVPTY